MTVPDRSMQDIGQEVYQRLVAAVHDASITPQEALSVAEVPMYVKTADGRLVLSNSQYDQFFAPDLSPVGRDTGKFLDHSILQVARISDDLILNGCEFAEFGHTGRSSNGDVLEMHTLKRSLLGIGHPTMAVLGITRIVRVTSDNNAARIQTLAGAWREFLQLHTRDQTIAIRIAQGAKIKAMAQELDVSEKTIENRRNVIYSALSVSGPTDLVKTMVRLQDNGFHDFGL